MKKIVSMMLAGMLLVAGLMTGCAQSGGGGAQSTVAPAATAKVLKVGAAVVPHAEILEFIKPKLRSEGVDLQVVVMDDEAQLNPALNDKQIDANYFQHVPYLDSVSKEKGYNFTVATKVHIEPIGFYSQKIKSADEIKVGSTIAIPNNPSNEYRALVLLENKGLLKLKAGISNYQATPRDIIDNPKQLKFVEVEAPQLTRVLPDVNGAVINTNYILDAKIDPASALFRENAESPYANIVVVRQGDENRDEIKKLDKALRSPEVKQFIQDTYKGAVVPAF
ncbi:MetQ/NlpA family ABC transporter substrate-binding protein [Heliophilum fasciatum]|uniref:Lipoprotein n=1 Tax=Heliophilum fasciatum TaxID=35700 RepID=A0A4V2SWJ3_9FIRM|nr:MetQ/NlpA family ABC transporter substrate-binding protein [Heliophilum fasciatum]MCW2278622.1 D-methionine transport system substrate-binding protein [Heliophilum fasciatum]TCP62676.1 D-methionine transport system substrate-binding protein [Heliophilum fasciatum]